MSFLLQREEQEHVTFYSCCGESSYPACTINSTPSEVLPGVRVKARVKVAVKQPSWRFISWKKKKKNSPLSSEKLNERLCRLVPASGVGSTVTQSSLCQKRAKKCFHIVKTRLASYLGR